MVTMKRMKKMWTNYTIVLGIALIVTAWLPTDLFAGSKGRAVGNGSTTNWNAGNNKLPGDPVKIRAQPSEPIKVRNTPTDPSASGGNERGIIIVSGKGGKDAKKIQQGIKINPGDAVGLNPQPLPPR
jgi:hypothetical protein